MTSTVSFKDRLRQCLTVFKWELRNCASPLMIFGIIAAVAVTVCLAACFSAALTDSFADTPVWDDIFGNIRAFQISASYAVFAVNAVFTIIYTIRVFSYLHNKRKADMYGALPISRRTFFAAKIVSAFLFSTVPALLLLSLIALGSALCGQLLVNEVAALFLNLPVGAIACIAFYGLLAVCCGTTANTIISFVCICLTYLSAAAFIRGTLMSFLRGLPVVVYKDSFIMTALDPIAAYFGGNLIYWLLFSAACLALGLLLVKKRRAECAQISFAYWLPAYLVKLLIAFNAGMFLGSIFGGIGVLMVPYLGFVFGFVLGSAAAYVIAHMILYRGTDKLLKTAIPLGAMVLTVAVGMAALTYDWWGYGSFVPDADSIESAGLVDLSDCYCAGTENVLSIAKMARDDYTDGENLRQITEFHRNAIRLSEDENRYASIWLCMLESGLMPESYFDTSGYVVSYRLNDSLLPVTRYYYDGMFDGDLYCTHAKAICESEAYFLNYSSLMNVKPAQIQQLTVGAPQGEYEYWLNEAQLTSGEGIDEQKLREDIASIVEAYRRDYRAHGEEGGKKLFDIELTYRKESGPGSLTSAVLGYQSHSGAESDSGAIYESYTETLQALRDAGVIDKDNQLDANSPYHYRNHTYHSVYGMWDD